MILNGEVAKVGKLIKENGNGLLPTVTCTWLANNPPNTEPACKGWCIS